MLWFTWCHTYNYDVHSCKNIEIPIITMIFAVTVIFKLGNNRQV